mgnify:CR=1 FL=1|jgi:hypothetical protein
MALLKKLIPSARVAHDLLGVVVLAFNSASSDKAWQVGKYSKELIQFLGPVHKEVLSVSHQPRLIPY